MFACHSLYQTLHILLSWEILFKERDAATEQAPMQLAAMAAGVGIALVTGAITGLIISLPIFDRVEEKDLYKDSTYWEVSTIPSSLSTALRYYPSF